VHLAWHRLCQVNAQNYWLKSIINKDAIMEALTIHQYMEKKLQEEGDRRVKRAEYREKKKANERVAEAELEAKFETEMLMKKNIRNLNAKGFSVEDIADIVMQPTEFVLEALKD
jgi:SOS response regulatory protein OraA/RecX